MPFAVCCVLFAVCCYQSVVTIFSDVEKQCKTTLGSQEGPITLATARNAQGEITDFLFTYGTPTVTGFQPKEIFIRWGGFAFLFLSSICNSSMRDVFCLEDE